MDNIPQMGTGQDLELRAARIADPGVGLYNFDQIFSPAEATFSQIFRQNTPSLVNSEK